MNFWITPVKDIEHIIEREKKDFRKTKNFNPEKIQGGDWILFYKKDVGVIGHARFINSPTHQPHLQPLEEYRDWNYFADVDSIKAYDPVVITKRIRLHLEWFKGNSVDNWHNFVIRTQKISLHDFIILSSGISGSHIRQIIEEGE